MCYEKQTYGQQMEIHFNFFYQKKKKKTVPRLVRSERTVHMSDKHKLGPSRRAKSFAL